MAQSIPPKVNPGDLIPSVYINKIIDALGILDQRVTKLVSVGSVTNPVIITGFTKPRNRSALAIRSRWTGAGFMDFRRYSINSPSAAWW